MERHSFNSIRGKPRNGGISDNIGGDGPSGLIPRSSVQKQWAGKLYLFICIPTVSRLVSFILRSHSQVSFPELIPTPHSQVSFLDFIPKSHSQTTPPVDLDPPLPPPPPTSNLTSPPNRKKSCMNLYIVVKFTVKLSIN